MKTAFILILLCMQDPSPVVDYQAGKVSPVSRAVANRPMATLPETSKALTREQWYEIRIATLEAEILHMQATRADERKAELIREAGVSIGAMPGWLYSEETGKFHAPKPQEKP